MVENKYLVNTKICNYNIYESWWSSTFILAETHMNLLLTTAAI